jgi:aspartyl-tRNA(Asn)/glutamyl-tRNA(Gln) amidotransferase subunit A
VPTLTPPPSETIEGLSEDLRRHRLSCRELLGRCLGRIDEWEPKVHAWVMVDREGALRQADQRDAEIARGHWRGPLHGTPVGVKDIIDVAGLPTECGAGRWKGRIAGADAPLVERLRQAGAVIVGKTVTTPYAWIDPPPTRNPWGLGHTPGGSSSGSAAALACGMIPGALGSQTGGSITRPASFCGVCGLKPTFGRLPVEGILPFAPSLDHPGPMARTVGDLARIWAALTGPGSEEIPPREGDGSIRLGRPRGLFDEQATPAMQAALEAAIARLTSAGIPVVEVRLPLGFADVPALHRLIMAAEAAGVHQAWLEEFPEDYPPKIRALVEEGLALPAAAYFRARRDQEAMRRSIGGLLVGVDALLTPAATGEAPGPDTTGDPIMNSPWSYTGLPTVTLPMGLSPRGLPLGLQLVGGPHREGPLLAVARRCEGVLQPPG